MRSGVTVNFSSRKDWTRLTNRGACIETHRPGKWNVHVGRRQIVLLCLSWFQMGLLWFLYFCGPHPPGCTGSGLVCIRYSSDEPCEWSARPRSCGNTHVWLVNHSPALASCSLFIGWLSSVFYTFSVWILWHPDGNVQWSPSHPSGDLQILSEM